jgi:glycosyltransferase involved in cell wall biosynthesis
VGHPLTFLTLGGCATRSKGSRLTLEAVRALGRSGRRFRLVVLGRVDPEIEAELAAIEAVELRGPYRPEQLDALLDEGDVGLLPSIWEEAHGFVGIEMLAKGLPLIANALGGIVEYVRDGESGWLNRDATGAGLAELMAHAIDDPSAVVALRRALRERREPVARPLAEHAAEVEALYAELTPPDRAARISSPAARRAAS